MKTVIKLSAVALALSIGISSSALAQGIPVIDASAIAASQKNWLQNLADNIQRYQMLQQQLNNARGVRGYGTVGVSDFQYIANDYQHLLSSSVGDFDKFLQMTFAFEQTLSPEIKESPAYAVFAASRNQIAHNRAVNDLMYRESGRRMGKIKELLEAINTTNDDKDIQELNARINVENAFLANEQIRLESLKMLMASQQDFLELQRKETAKRLGTGSIPQDWSKDIRW
jgi:type IV secretion system protein VirB5